MSEIITFPLPAGPNFTIPDIGDENWGQSVTDYLVAIPLGVPPTSGTFSLTGDLFFGASFGLVSQYFKSPTVNPASTGIVRLAKTDLIDWRNNANSANLGLGINGSDQLIFNGSTVLVSNTGNLTDAGTDGIIITGGTGAVLGSGTSIAQHVADTSHNGYLSSTDWNTFHGKGVGTVTSVALTVPAFLSISGSPVTSSGTLAIGLSGTPLSVVHGGTGQTVSGNLSDAGTDGITVTGGIGSTITDVSLAQHVADATHNGYLSSTDWTTFNGAAGGGISSLTGAVLGTGPGVTATTFGVNPTFSSASTNNTLTITSSAATFSARVSNTNVFQLIDNASGGGPFITYTHGSPSVTTFSGAITLSLFTPSQALALDSGGSITTVPNTGTGNNVLATSPTLVTPNIGSATATGLAMGSNKITGLANGTAATDAMAFGQLVAPTVQQFTSSSGTYTTPTSPRTPLYLMVTVVGPGGGGSGGGTGGNNGSAGSAASMFSAGSASAGAGAGGSFGGNGGAGGTNSLTTSGTIISVLGISGGTGEGSSFSSISGSVQLVGSIGGSTPLGGGATGAVGTGTAGRANTGEGGAGGRSGASGLNDSNGSGGGGGGYLKYIVTSPSATYTYAIGTGGAGGTSTAGSGTTGGAGASGGVVVEEHYQ